MVVICMLIERCLNNFEILIKWYMFIYKIVLFFFNVDRFYEKRYLVELM